jgi:hypothetical protein
VLYVRYRTVSQVAAQYHRKMLHDFLTANRKELIRRCRDKVAKRFESSEPAEIPAALDHGVPLFLQQLVDTLRLEQLTPVREAAEPEPTPAPSAIGRAAALHGAELLRLGYSVDQVVHDYGDVCQSVTEMAVEQKELISADEFRTLNRCLDNAIADAVTSHGSARQILINDRAQTLHMSLNAFADEQRRLVNIAIQAYSAIKTGEIGLTGATGTLLIHSLEELHSLADRTLPEIRLASTATSIAPAATSATIRPDPGLALANRSASRQ